MLEKKGEREQILSDCMLIKICQLTFQEEEKKNNNNNDILRVH